MKKLLLFASIAVMPLISCSSSDDDKNNFETKIIADKSSKITAVIDGREYIYDNISIDNNLIVGDPYTLPDPGDYGIKAYMGDKDNSNFLLIGNYRAGHGVVSRNIYLKVVKDEVEYISSISENTEINITDSLEGNIKGDFKGLLLLHSSYNENNSPEVNISSGTIDIKYTYEEVEKEN